MTSELIIINVEVGNMTLENIEKFIKHLKDAVSKQFNDEYEYPPKCIFVPTRDGVCKCTQAGPSEVLKVITCEGKTLDLDIQALLDTYGEQIMEGYKE